MEVTVYDLGSLSWSGAWVHCSCFILVVLSSCVMSAFVFPVLSCFPSFLFVLVVFSCVSFPPVFLVHGRVLSLLNCIHVSLTCVLSVRLSPAHQGCMERLKETKVRREEMRKDVLREMRRPFLGGVT